MKHIYIKTLGIIGIVTVAFALSEMQIAQAEPVTLQCSNLDEGGFQISILKEGQQEEEAEQSTPMLRVKDSSSIRQSCDQIKTKLEQAIRTNGLDKLLLVAHEIGRDDAICVVKSSRDGCSRKNLLLDVPDGRDRDAFLDEIVVFEAETFFSGSKGQHTQRRKYAKFSSASNRNTK